MPQQNKLVSDFAVRYRTKFDQASAASLSFSVEHKALRLADYARRADDDLPLSAIGRDFVQRWLETMAGTKPRTIRRRLATVKIHVCLS